MKDMNQMIRSLVALFSAAVVIIAVFVILADGVFAQDRGPGGERERGPNQIERNEDGSSPIPMQSRRGNRPDRGRGPGNSDGPGGGFPLEYPDEFRTIDGTDNNLENPEWGAAITKQLRLTTVDYADGMDAPAGVSRVSARAVSNAVVAQEESMENSRRASDYLWQWGQFLDHDLDETPGADPAEALNILVPAGDVFFDPGNTGVVEIPMNRSAFEYDEAGIRQQENEITSYIDASNVYGSDEARAFALRTLDGTGRLRTSAGDLMPFNEVGLPNAGGTGANLFLGGDVRANEQVGLAAMHILFVREHNYWADMISDASPNLTGEEVYQLARMIVGAEMQAITYNEFLPVLLGEDVLRPYRGYDPGVNAGIANVFATAAYRVGHTLLSPQLQRIDANGDEAPEGHLPLLGAFFAPSELIDNGVDSLLRGLANQVCQEIDNKVVDDVRNFLFGPPGAGGFDLASLNIQRGRDHGLPGFNEVRRNFGLRSLRDIGGIHPDPAVSGALASVYASVEDVDAWVGLLAEPHVNGGMVGRTLAAVLSDQFERLRDGDRFWYESAMSSQMVSFINDQTLAVIIRRNTGIGEELSDNVFVVDDRGRGESDSGGGGDDDRGGDDRGRGGRGGDGGGGGRGDGGDGGGRR
ncbi:MAG: peroxidase family protein [Verrucomicrobiota bacterium]